LANNLAIDRFSAYEITAMLKALGKISGMICRGGMLGMGILKNQFKTININILLKKKRARPPCETLGSTRTHPLGKSPTMLIFHILLKSKQ
jgi:hypothetical protein